MALDPSEFPVQAAPFDQRLENFGSRVKGGQARVVAIGSSTTAGEGGIAPYPQRLLADLRIKYPNVGIEVINRGVGGEDAPLELKRFEHDVFDLNPDLVIWQVGTNSVWQPPTVPSFADTTKAIREGVDQLLGAKRIDVILMDLQYVPAVLTPAKHQKDGRHGRGDQPDRVRETGQRLPPLRADEELARGRKDLVRPFGRPGR